MDKQILLKSKKGIAALSVVKDDYTDSCSISVIDGGCPQIKYISKELYDQLVSELANQEHI